MSKASKGSSGKGTSNLRANQCSSYFERPSCGWTEYERCARRDDGSLAFYCCCKLGVPPPPPPSPSPPPASPPLPPHPPRSPPPPVLRPAGGVVLLSTAIACVVVLAVVAVCVFAALAIRRRRRWDAQNIEDHYAVLGVHPSASFEQVRSAYLDLARKLHPDKQLTASERGSTASSTASSTAAADNDIEIQVRSAEPQPEGAEMEQDGRGDESMGASPEGGEDQGQQPSAASAQSAEDAMGKDVSPGLHEDVGGGEAEDTFARVQAAWEVLKNEQRRAKYDEKLARAVRLGRLLPGGASSSAGKGGPKRRLQLSSLVSEYYPNKSSVASKAWMSWFGSNKG
mmetsp:Transcript_59042/g.135391  ORF Transcript_59042/g.135391 Transcript_59042/m.135391 type:complete len:341 (-) Transcript_59042:387-1409(-)|eukprot:CAMPEP_0119352838 /NCGR_PEP_ID=MMETSP1334-20130426/2039_1 /TAXON_ID=127549 /ORGANISM="Calcidiscus leptoporus, Strain RCC1130" /LENGTH=340 /DNA_ID=CAMNT_0007365961 /DNA_START=93 /DNA_END=1115 /DNA_ORIENTATION=+